RTVRNGREKSVDVPSVRAYQGAPNHPPVPTFVSSPSCALGGFLGESMRRIVQCVLCFLLVAPVFSQTATEYSEKDKKKMAEIAQRPEVQQRIDEEWKQIQQQDLAFAYQVNTVSRMAALSPASLAELRTKYGQLYDNPILLRYVNTLGQRLVPRNSPNLYAFRLLLDPMPRAMSLSTGTIYVSTGLVSMLDNE